MANEVYANGREIACKAASGKSIAAFPDTCLSPPSPPAGPVPIPYPNTAYASDTTDGSKTVMISGQEVMLKDQSTFKKSTGDEAATKSLGMGVVTHQITGEVSFVSWSMDVKIEGENVDRHLDMTVHNEQSEPPNTPPMAYVDSVATTSGEEPPKCPPHAWYEDDSQTPEETKKRNKENADHLRSKPSKAREAKGPEFENTAIDANMDKMKIQATSLIYRCHRCGEEQEVDIKGENQIAEAKSRTAKGWKNKSKQSRNYREIQSQVFGSETPPLAKLDKDMPDAAESQGIMSGRGHATELL
jgi:hypothetical protein